MSERTADNSSLMGLADATFAVDLPYEQIKRRIGDAQRTGSPLVELPVDWSQDGSFGGRPSLVGIAAIRSLRSYP
jgi:hypothetical protein